MPRKKIMSDSEVLDKAFFVISYEGFESFTFAQVGKKVGLSPAALVKRFKTKKNLATLARNHRWDKNLAKMTEEQINSLKGLEGIFDFIHLIAMSVDSKKLGEHLRWLGTEAEEIKSRKKMSSYFELTRQIFSRLLAESIQMGELSSELNPKAFAPTLEALVQGAIFQFAYMNHRSVESHIKKHVQLILEPYLR